MSNVQTIPVDSISIATRKRAISPEKVSDIRRSVKQQGLLQPIGVKVDGEGYLLIYGAHRLAAFQEDDYPEITAMVFPESMTEDECFLAEIQENLARNDLTGAERKAFAAEVGRLITVLSSDYRDDEDSRRESDWLREWRDKSGIGQNTAYTWWKSFCTETDRNITPRQATQAPTSHLAATIGHEPLPMPRPCRQRTRGGSKGNVRCGDHASVWCR